MTPAKIRGRVRLTAGPPGKVTAPASSLSRTGHRTCADFDDWPDPTNTPAIIRTVLREIRRHGHVLPGRLRVARLIRPSCVRHDSYADGHTLCTTLAADI
ncbi:hypothetical protein GCM10020218_076650 [Dactylosporangium vinaceum]